MRYFVVVQAEAYRLSDQECALESAFASHLKALRADLGNSVEELVLLSPEMPAAQYLAAQGSLAILDARSDNIRYIPSHRNDVSRGRFLLRHLLPTWLMLNRVISVPCVVHSGMSDHLAKPVMFMACIAAWRKRQPVVFVVDMDFRNNSRQNYELGSWSFASFLVNRFVYDPLKWLQLWLAPRLFDLCLLKGQSMVDDFGKGRKNVRSFLDAAHSSEHVLGGPELEKKLQILNDDSRPLRLVYFGRLVPYKGIDRIIDAVCSARKKGVDVRLRIIGNGESKETLQRKIAAAEGDAWIELLPALPYGTLLFQKLDDCHLTVAAPLAEDTPRAALDSMARGIPVIAFDIAYFSDLKAAGAAVITTPWPSSDGLADAMVEVAGNRARLHAMCIAAVQFAAQNTQEIWVQRRLSWLREIVESKVRISR
jgi:glycosyltransferase involved in cell wall biosynthesis